MVTTTPMGSMFVWMDGLVQPMRSAWSARSAALAVGPCDSMLFGGSHGVSANHPNFFMMNDYRPFALIKSWPKQMTIVKD